MPGPLTKSIASIFREAAEQHGLTQQQIADAIGQSQQQVSRYLNAEVTMDAEEIYKMCRILDVNIVDLITAADKEARSQE